MDREHQQLTDDGCPHHPEPARQGPDLRDVPTEIDTGNRFIVGLRGEEVVCFNPPRTGDRITREDALVLAGWLVAIADPQLVRFPRIFEAICGT